MGSRTKDDEFLSITKEMFQEKIPFNKFLGLEIESISPDCVKTSFEMRQEFLGFYKRKILHGGIISSVLDATGGLATLVSSIEKMQIKTLEEKIKRFGSLSTIDLRVDYLRPGIGKRFVVTANTLRTGKKVVVIRLELHNEQNDLIAVGTGSYLLV